MKTAAITTPSREDVYNLLCSLNETEAAIRKTDGALSRSMSQKDRDALERERAGLIRSHIQTRQQWLEATCGVAEREKASANAELEELRPRMADANAALRARWSAETAEAYDAISEQVGRFSSQIASANAEVIRARERVDAACGRWA